MSLRIYCVHPISGLSADDVFNYYDRTMKALTSFGYDVMIPMFGKDSLRTELKFKSHDYRSPLTMNHSIFGRDKWMCTSSDIIYANFLGTGHVSIGSMFELAWGNIQNKQVIVVMDKENIHQHAFVLEAATIVFETEQEALDYLNKLASKHF